MEESSQIQKEKEDGGDRGDRRKKNKKRRAKPIKTKLRKFKLMYLNIEILEV